MSNIRIDIASEFKEKGFKKAQKSTTMLDKQFKQLARTFATVFSTRQIIAFGKASVKAFADDQVAARRLTQTLSSMNLAFEDPRLSAFISQLQRQSGVLDDQLRPAMESLLRTTGSVTESQRLLGLAIDVAAGSGVDLQTVAADLAKAYVGNTRGLIKYNLGLTKTELAAKSFLEVQDKLTQQYGGQNAAFLETYTGKVNLLKVAYANMQETIGKELVNAFTELSGKNGIGGATQAMEDFGLNVGYAIAGVVGYIQMLDRSISGIGLNPLIKFFIESQGAFQLLQNAINLGKKLSTTAKPFSTPMTVTGQTDYYKKQDKARAKAEADAAKRAKELDALRKKQETERLKREKLLAAQKRAQTIFDMENIQIVAAMQGKIDGEQRMRLTALLALNTENFVAAEKLTDIIVRLNAPALANLGVMIQAGDTIDDVIKKLITSQAKLAGLQLLAEDFPMPEDIFQEWEDSLDSILQKLLDMLALLAALNGTTSKANPFKMGAVQRGEYANDPYIPLGSSVFPELRPYADITSLGLGSAARGEYSSFSGNMASGGTTVVVNVGGNVTTERDLVSSITEALYVQQKSGQQVVFNSVTI